MKIKKYVKVAGCAAMYAAELVAATYLGIKIKERYDEGDISTLRYAVEGTALTLGVLAAAWPTCEFGVLAIEDALEPEWEAEEK